MSTITGYVRQINAQAAIAQVQFKQVSGPWVVDGALIMPTQMSAASNASGAWSIVLARGQYELWVGSSQHVTIDVPDDTDTYSFDQLVISTVNPPEPPVGGAQPTASEATLGLVYTDTNESNPRAVTGMWWVQDVTEARTVPSRPWNKTLQIAGQAEIYDWESLSTAADDDGVTTLKPDDTDAADPGRWVIRPGSGGGGGSSGVYSKDDLAGMRAIASSAANRLCHLKSLPAGSEETQGKFYEWHNDADAAEDLPLVVVPDDAPATGRWIMVL